MTVTQFEVGDVVEVFHVPDNHYVRVKGYNVSLVVGERVYKKTLEPMPDKLTNGQRAWDKNFVKRVYKKAVQL